MFKKKTEDESLQKAIENVYEEMTSVNTDSDEYSNMVDQLSKLYALKALNDKASKFSKDTVMTAMAHIAGIAMIVGHERTGIITSKAFGLIGKLK